MSETIRLRSGTSVADVTACGAELQTWSVDGTPLLWTPDPAIWPDTAPILFPVVGWTRGSRVLIEGRSYPLSLHGFARHRRFALTKKGADFACFTLISSVEDAALYPFAFALSVSYRLSPSSLTTELSVHNTGPGPMPYACGLHPGFCWPFAAGGVDDHAVIFAERESPHVPIITADGLFTSARRAVPLKANRLALSARLFEREALCFLDVASRTIRFVNGGGATIAVSLEGFPHVALWSRPAGRFLSIEAWTGYGDAADSDGDLLRKPSMIHLAAGATRRHVATYAYDGGPVGDGPLADPTA